MSTHTHHLAWIDCKKCHINTFYNMLIYTQSYLVLTYFRFKIFLDKLYFVDISATFTFPSFIYLQHKVVLFTFEVETQKKIRSLRNTKWDELHEGKMQHNFTFINILKLYDLVRWLLRERCGDAKFTIIVW